MRFMVVSIEERSINIDAAKAIDSGLVPSFASVTDYYVKYGFKEGRLTNDNWTRAQLEAGGSIE